MAVWQKGGCGVPPRRKADRGRRVGAHDTSPRSRSARSCGVSSVTVDVRVPPLAVRVVVVLVGGDVRLQMLSKPFSAMSSLGMATSPTCSTPDWTCEQLPHLLPRCEQLLAWEPRTWGPLAWARQAWEPMLQLPPRQVIIFIVGAVIYKQQPPRVSVPFSAR